MSTTIEIKTAEEAIQKGLAIPKLAPMAKVYEGVGLIVTKLAALVVKTPEEFDKAMIAIKEGKAIIKALEVAEDGIIANPEGFVKSVKGLRKLIQGPINLGLNDANKKVTDFQNDQHTKRLEEAEKLRLKALKEAEKIPVADTSKEAAKIEKKVEKIEAKIEAVATYKHKNVDRVRKFEVINPNEVERLYCSPDDSKIKPCIGEVDVLPYPVIKGVKIWDTAKPVGR